MKSNKSIINLKAKNASREIYGDIQFSDIISMVIFTATNTSVLLNYVHPVVGYYSLFYKRITTFIDSKQHN